MLYHNTKCIPTDPNKDFPGHDWGGSIRFQTSIEYRSCKRCGFEISWHDLSSILDDPDPPHWVGYGTPFIKEIPESCEEFLMNEALA